MLYALRLVHILSGMFWVGTVLFTTLLLMPSLRAAGAAAGPLMAELGKRRMPVVMMGVAFLTIGSGVWLMTIASGGDMGLWMRSGTGRTFAWGGALAIVTLALGMAINMPAARRMAAINDAATRRGGPPNPEEGAELQRLQRRMAIGSQIVAILLVFATAAMAVARYVP